MRYIPHTPDDIRAMLRIIGVHSIEELFQCVPSEVRQKEALGLPHAMSEPDLLLHLHKLAHHVHNGLAFLGAGAYAHHIPTAISQLTGRSEFYTAYTPYQPEISQGTLQAIFEFQTMICQLTGMEVANASLYDGASAVAEACLMAHRVTKKKHILMAKTIHPSVEQVVRTYTSRFGMTIEFIPFTQAGQIDLSSLQAALDRFKKHNDEEGVACVVVQNPNFYGVIEHLTPIADLAHKHSALCVASFTEALSLALLKSPGDCGADIVAGEGQSFGLPLSFGGPYLGLFAAKEKYLRQMPGRLVGETVDQNDRRGFVLTLSTREQHIRREKATSNICTNQGLCALTASVYLALMGRKGLYKLAQMNLSLAAYAKRQIASLPHFSLRFHAPTFNEFVVTYDKDLSLLLSFLHRQRIYPGLCLKRFSGDEHDLLICVTEIHRKEDIDRLVSALQTASTE